MLIANNVTGFSGYVSQKKWKDSDRVVECTVECNIDGVPHKTVFYAACPLTAIEKARDNFENYNWIPIEES